MAIHPYPRNSENAAMFPPAHAQSVTPSDVDDPPNLPGGVTGLWVGTAGAVRVKMLSGADVTFPAVPTGQWFPCQCVHVYATGTVPVAIIAGSQ